MSVEWSKTANRMLEQIDGIDVHSMDLDNVAYYMTHLSSPKMWARLVDFGEALVYHGRNAQSNTTDEGDQLWLPFSKP
jgi:hypothetical protein